MTELERIQAKVFNIWRVLGNTKDDINDIIRLMRTHLTVSEYWYVFSEGGADHLWAESLMKRITEYRPPHKLITIKYQYLESSCADCDLQSWLAWVEDELSQYYCARHLLAKLELRGYNSSKLYDAIYNGDVSSTESEEWKRYKKEVKA